MVSAWLRLPQPLQAKVGHRFIIVVASLLAVEASKSICLLQDTIPKRRMQSYSFLVTIVSPDKALLIQKV